MNESKIIKREADRHWDLPGAVIIHTSNPYGWCEGRTTRIYLILGWCEFDWYELNSLAIVNQLENTSRHFGSKRMLNGPYALICETIERHMEFLLCSVYIINIEMDIRMMWVKAEAHQAPRLIENYGHEILIWIRSEWLRSMCIPHGFPNVDKQKIMCWHLDENRMRPTSPSMSICGIDNWNSDSIGKKKNAKKWQWGVTVTFTTLNNFSFFLPLNFSWRGLDAYA